MSQHATQLCVILVNEVYGELSSRVFHTLMRHGRLALPPLAHHSKLPIRQIKHGLAVLIQQHLVRHHTGSEDNHITYYEADWMEAYVLLRSGKVIMMAEQRCGQAAGELVSNLLLQGHTTTKDLAKAYLAVAKAGGRSEAAAVADGESTLVQLDATLRKLLDDGLVRAIKADQLRPPTDNYNEAVRVVNSMDIHDGMKGSKKNMQFEAKVRETLREWRRDGQDGQKGVKRRLDDGDGGSRAKRARTSLYDGVSTNGYVNPSMDHETLPNVDENLVICVSFEKYSVLSRNQRLAELVEQKIGTVPSAVYAELLNRLSRKIPRCQDDLAEEDDENDEESWRTDGPTVSTIELTTHLSPDIDLASGIGKAPPAPKLPNGIKRRLDDDDSDVDEGTGKTPEVIDDDAEDDSDRDSDHHHHRPAVPALLTGGIHLVKQHLQLLAAQPHRFVSQTKSQGQGTWAANFNGLIGALKQSSLEDIIHARFGSIALRIVRVLSTKGKLDEKQISNMALVRQKDIRATLTSMHEAGFLELQEVPRDNVRQTSKTLFLWFFDPDRTRLMVLEDMYKTMARLLQRAKKERTLLRGLLEKAERTDVVGHEEELLSREERRTLLVWRDKEERLLGQLLRLDRMVELFRDF
ncbi:MAG: RNA polymerase III subunit C82 [Peltula sp. TS41687]|nr:MAG: RNA polymerase III subunit C82 [Peltula sp. TS41687]